MMKKLEIIRDSTFGAIPKYHTGENVPDQFERVRSSAIEQFGEGGIAAIQKAAGMDHENLSIVSLPYVAFALGYAAGSGRAQMKVAAPLVTTTATASLPALDGKARAQETIDRINSDIAAEKGRARANEILAKQGLPPIHSSATASTTAPAKKDFPAIVREFETKGMTKGAAVSAAVKQFPEAHQTWLRGDTSKL